MPSDRLLGKHTLLHCYCRGVFYQKSAAGSLLLVPSHHHVTTPRHHVTTPRHHVITPPRHHVTTPRRHPPSLSQQKNCTSRSMQCDRMTASACSLYHYLFKEPYFLTFARTNFISCTTGKFRNASPYTVSSCGSPSDCTLNT